MSETEGPSVGINRGARYWCAACGDLPRGPCEHFPQSTQFPERLRIAESKLAEFGQKWNGEKYVFNGEGR